ncbi:MAG: YigZ family protein [Candidatus Delongbacteria bacterium]
MQTDGSSDEYPAPVAPAEHEERIERSRFLALLRPVTEPAQVAEFLDSLRKEHHKATHHCSAWRCGPPGASPRWGAADDGEPSGSAGLPILKAIEGSGLSDVAVVVVRWFGGVKLGTGGLVRAYGGVAAQVLAACPRRTVVCRLPLFARFPLPLMTQVRRLTALHGAVETRLQRTHELCLDLQVPASRLAELEQALGRLFQGKGDVWRS